MVFVSLEREMRVSIQISYILFNFLMFLSKKKKFTYSDFLFFNKAEKKKKNNLYKMLFTHPVKFESSLI